MYSCFEACSVKKCILQRSGEGNQLTENNSNQGEAKEVRIAIKIWPKKTTRTCLKICLIRD